MNFFGRKSETPAPKRVTAAASSAQMAELQRSVDQFEKSHAHTTAQMTVLLREMKLLKGSKKASDKSALSMKLTKFKGLKKRQEMMSSYLRKLTGVQQAVETAKFQAGMIEGLTSGASALEGIMGGRDVADEISRANDDLEDAMDRVDEVSEVLIDSAPAMDAEADDAELEALLADEDMIDGADAAALPAAAAPAAAAPMAGLPELPGLPAVPMAAAMPSVPSRAPGASASASAASAPAGFEDLMGEMG